jgi:hypothetical protein
MPSQKAGGEEVAIWHDTNSAIPTDICQPMEQMMDMSLLKKLFIIIKINDIVGSVYDNTLTINYVVDSVVFEYLLMVIILIMPPISLLLVKPVHSNRCLTLYVSYVAQDM